MNKAEFTRRVLARQDTLYRICCGMLREEQDRRDAVQEAVIRAWAKLPQLKDARYFETWLTRILINVCYDLLSRSKRIVPLEAVPEPSAMDAKDSALRDALLALEMDLRLLVILYYMEGYKLREIAEILKLPEGTVKTRLTRAKRKLRELLKEDGI